MKPADTLPWYAWDPRAFASDPEVQRLQKRYGRDGPRAYRDLLDVCWVEGGLPSDPVAALELAGLEPNELPMVADILDRLFPQEAAWRPVGSSESPAELQRSQRRWNRRLLECAVDGSTRVKGTDTQRKQAGKSRVAGARRDARGRLLPRETSSGTQRKSSDLQRHSSGHPANGQRTSSDTPALSSYPDPYLLKPPLPPKGGQGALAASRLPDTQPPDAAPDAPAIHHLDAALMSLEQAWRQHCEPAGLGPPWPPGARDSRVTRRLLDRLDADPQWLAHALQAIERIPRSGRLCGRDSTDGWRASLAWLTQEGRVGEILLGANWGLTANGEPSAAPKVEAERMTPPPKKRRVKKDCRLCSGEGVWNGRGRSELCPCVNADPACTNCDGHGRTIDDMNCECRMRASTAAGMAATAAVSEVRK